MDDLAVLGPEITAQLALDVESPEPALVRAHIERVTGHPHVVHPAILRLVPRHRAGMLHVRHIDHLQSAVGTPCCCVLGALHARAGEDLVGDEHVVVVAPCGVGAANETGPTYRLDFTVQCVEVVFVLGHQLGVGRAAALHAVAHVEDHQSVVPVRQIREAILDVDVVQGPAGIGPIGAPLPHFLRMRWIADVHHMHGAGAVVGQVDMGAVLLLLKDERRVDAGVHALGELRNHLRVKRIVEGGDDDPVLAV